MGHGTSYCSSSISSKMQIKSNLEREREKESITHILPPFQIVNRFVFFRYVVFIMCLDIAYI
jgi:hypothetical protein